MPQDNRINQEVSTISQRRRTFLSLCDDVDDDDDQSFLASDDQDDDDDSDEYYDGNTDEDPDEPPVTALDPTAARSKISVVNPPEHPVELPGVAQPENEVDCDVVPLLFQSDYDINYEYDDEYEDTYTFTQ